MPSKVKGLSINPESPIRVKPGKSKPKKNLEEQGRISQQIKVVHVAVLAL